MGHAGPSTEGHCDRELVGAENRVIGAATFNDDELHEGFTAALLRDRGVSGRGSRMMSPAEEGGSRGRHGLSSCASNLGPSAKAANRVR